MEDREGVIFLFLNSNTIIFPKDQIVASADLETQASPQVNL